MTQDQSPNTNAPMGSGHFVIPRTSPDLPPYLVPGATSIVEALNHLINQGFSDFSYTDLSGADLRNLQIESFTSFAHANLPKTNLSGLYAQYVNFTNADVRGAKIVNADFPHATFERTNLTNAHLQNSRFPSATFNNSNLVGANLYAASFPHATFFRTDLSHASASRATFYHSSFNECNAITADLRNADFAYAAINNCDFKESSLPGAHFLRTEVFDTQFHVDVGHIHLPPLTLAVPHLNTLVSYGPLIEVGSSHIYLNEPDLLDKVRMYVEDDTTFDKIWPGVLSLLEHYRDQFPPTEA